MDCQAYCRVSRYDLSLLQPIIQAHYPCEQLDEAIKITPAAGDESNSLIFVFNYGVVVFWEVPEAQHEMWLEKFQECAAERSTIEEHDSFYFEYASVPRITRKTIHLPDQSPLSKLAVSHAIAQSVKLGMFEQSIEKTIQNTRHIPHTLAEKGHQPLSQKELRKVMGQVYIERSSINLHFDLLDEPEFFWEYEELEPLYSMTRKYLDIQDRIFILNQKLEVVGELVSMLSEELKHKHSSRLEWIIIWLIAIEIVLILFQEYHG